MAKCYWTRISPQLKDELESIKLDKGLIGKRTGLIAQTKLVEYSQVGRKLEKMFENMTMGIYKDRRK